MSRKFLEEVQADLESQLRSEGEKPLQFFSEDCRIWVAKHRMRVGLREIIHRILSSTNEAEFARRLKRLTRSLYDSEKNKANWEDARFGIFRHKLRDTLDKLLSQVGIKEKVAASVSASLEQNRSLLVELMTDYSSLLPLFLETRQGRIAFQYLFKHKYDSICLFAQNFPDSFLCEHLLGQGCLSPFSKELVAVNPDVELLKRYVDFSKSGKSLKAIRLAKNIAKKWVFEYRPSARERMQGISLPDQALLNRMAALSLVAEALVLLDKEIKSITAADKETQLSVSDYVEGCANLLDALNAVYVVLGERNELQSEHKLYLIGEITKLLTIFSVGCIDSCKRTQPVQTVLKGLMNCEFLVGPLKGVEDYQLNLRLAGFGISVFARQKGPESTFVARTGVQPA